MLALVTCGMQQLQAEFVKSSTRAAEAPEPDKPEYAFIGRSNVGKSSLINRLVGRKKLAKTSGTPGKTQLINHFLIEQKWYLVDLPGYGYAKLSKKTRAELAKIIENYLSNRQNLVHVFVLVDIRVPPQEADLEMLRTLGKAGVSCSVVFTKTDKLSANKTQSQAAAFARALKKDWEQLPYFRYSSSVTGAGCEDIIDFIHQTNESLGY